MSCITWCSVGNGPLTTGAGGGGGVTTLRAVGSCDEGTGLWTKSDVGIEGNIEAVGCVVIFGGNTGTADEVVVGLKWNVDWGSSLATGRNGEVLALKPSKDGPGGFKKLFENKWLERISEMEFTLTAFGFAVFITTVGGSFHAPAGLKSW